MARLTFPSDRLVYQASTYAGSAFTSSAGATATVYSDANGTTLADVQNIDGTANPSATFTVDTSSRLPLFLGPANGSDTLYVKVGTGPVTPIYAVTAGDISAAVGTEVTNRQSADALLAKPRGAWAPTTAYAVNDVVISGGTAYRCLTAHTSGGSFSGAGVNWESWSSATSVSLADKGNWTTTTAYAVGDVVSYGGLRYIAKTAHTSGTFATDLAAGDWTATSVQNAQVTYDIRQFGAKCDGRFVLDAAYNGSTGITSATAAFTAADVGKLVLVVSTPAGVAAAQYKTGTVSAVNSSTSITITAANGSCGNVTGAQLLIGSDEQAAFNSAITSMASSRGLCYVPDGLYMCSATIAWPYVATTGGSLEQKVMGFVGQTPPQQVRWNLNHTTPPMSGAVIVGTNTINSQIMTVAAGGASNINVVLRRMSFRLPPNCNSSWLKLGNANCVDLDEVTCEVQAAVENLADPTAYGWPVAFEMPINFNGAYAVAKRCQAVGAGHGFDVYEHSVLDATTTYCCNIGYYPKGMDHAARAGRIAAYWSQYALQANDAICYWDIQQLDIEDAPSSQPTWQKASSGNHIYDNNNYMSGTVRIHRVISGTGARDWGLSFAGCKKMSITTTASNQQTLPGTTAGSAVWAVPLSSPDWRKVMVYLNGYENTTATAQTITFPIAFTQTPFLSKDDSGGATVSTTTLTLPASMGATKTGWIVVEGF